MKLFHKLSSLLGILFLIAATLACNLPASVTEEPTEKSPEELAATMVAQTVQAGVAENPATVAVSVTITPTSLIVTVNTATNCRTGPSVNYSFLMVLQPGTPAPLVGKYTPSNYWIITMPNGNTCWLMGTYATTQGDTSQLPEMTPPALANTQPNTNSASSGNDNSGSGNNDDNGSDDNNSSPASPPAAPSNVKATTSCAGGRSDLLTWHAVSDATAYNIYKDGGLIEQITAAQAGGGALLNWLVSPGNVQNPISYGIAAVNGQGVSSISSATALGCP